MSRRQAARVVLALFAGMPAVHRVGVAQEGKTTAKGEAKVSRLASDDGDLPKAFELRRFKAHSDWVLSVALTPDEKTLVTGGNSADHTARAWDFATGKELFRIDTRGGGPQRCRLPRRPEGSRRLLR